MSYKIENHDYGVRMKQVGACVRLVDWMDGRTTRPALPRRPARRSIRVSKFPTDQLTDPRTWHIKTPNELTR